MDPRVQALLAYDEADPLGDLESADAVVQPSAPTELHGQGCKLIGDLLRLTASELSVSVASAGDGFVVAGYERLQDREQVRLLAIGPQGLPRPLGTVALTHPLPGDRRAGPGLHASDENHVTLAVVDGQGSLRVGELSTTRSGAAPAMRQLASGVDARFAPSVTHFDGGTLVAWTEGSTPMAMHYALLSVDGKAPVTDNLTPPRQGAAGATFVRGARLPTLVAVDARDGMSPLIVVPFDRKGAPGTPRPGGPVGMVSSPTQLSAAHADFGDVLGYTGLGSASTSAVGVVALDRGGASPEALIRGTAYGPLHVAAVPAGDHVVLSADAPLQPGKTPPHEIRILRVDSQGKRRLGALRAEGADLSHASLARTRSGLMLLVYRAPGGTHAARLRCN